MFTSNCRRGDLARYIPKGILWYSALAEGIVHSRHLFPLMLPLTLCDAPLQGVDMSMRGGISASD